MKKRLKLSGKLTAYLTLISGGGWVGFALYTWLFPKPSLLLLGAGLFSWLLVAVLSAYGVHRALEPLGGLLASAQALSQGSYRLPPPTGRADELGEISQALFETGKGLREGMEQAKRLLCGVSAGREPSSAKGELAQLLEEIRQTVPKQRGTLAKARSGMVSVCGTSQRLCAQMAALERGTAQVLTLCGELTDRMRQPTWAGQSASRKIPTHGPLEKLQGEIHGLLKKEQGTVKNLELLQEDAKKWDELPRKLERLSARWQLLTTCTAQALAGGETGGLGAVTQEMELLTRHSQELGAAVSLLSDHMRRCLKTCRADAAVLESSLNAVGRRCAEELELSKTSLQGQTAAPAPWIHRVAVIGGVCQVNVAQAKRVAEQAGELVQQMTQLTGLASYMLPLSRAASSGACANPMCENPREISIGDSSLTYEEGS